MKKKKNLKVGNEVVAFYEKAGGRGEMDTSRVYDRGTVTEVLKQPGQPRILIIRREGGNLLFHAPAKFCMSKGKYLNLVRSVIIESAGVSDA